MAVVAAFSAAAALALLGTGPVAAEGGRGGDKGVADKGGDGSAGGGSAEVVPATPLVISEFRVRGPNGANDEFIEITNVSAMDHTVAGGGTGYALAASNGVARCVIPNGTVVPAFASYLCVNSVGYSLASYPAGNGTTATGDATYTTDIPDNAGIALFNTSVAADFTPANRLDAVGSTSEANTLYKEGTGYPALTPFSIDYSFYRNLSTASITSTTLDTATPGVPEDTDNNAADFVFVDTNGTSAGAGQRLGAPGPSNLSSPTTNGNLDVDLLDPCVGELSPPNAVRDFTSDPANNSTFGTFDLRRTITNNTGGPVTRLRLRVADVRTFPAPSGIADMRPRTSTAVVVTVDRAPCGSGTSNVTVQGTTLEQPPSQPNGGGFNSSMSVGTVTLATPLANGASVDVRLLTGIQQTGANGIRVIAEALTAGNDNVPDTGTCLGGPEGDNLCGWSNGQDIAIPTSPNTSGVANPYPSTIETDFPAGTTVTDVNVGIHGYSHTFPDDVDVLLVAPDGTSSSMIMSDVGSSFDVAGINLTLDDEAASALPDGSALASGTFKPTDALPGDVLPAPAPATVGSGTLTTFDGKLADGTWSLYVFDDAGGDVGVISGWSLDLETAPGCEGQAATIVGSDAADVITGTPGADVIVTMGGDDTINGGGGNDRICAGAGSDTIRDQGGADRVFGEANNDTIIQSTTMDAGDVLHGGDGADTVSYNTRAQGTSLSLNGVADDGEAGEGDRLLAVENLTGGGGADTIVGNSEPNALVGNGGNDTITDAGGADTATGGDGSDTFITPAAADTADVYDGGAGNDRASYALRSGGVDVSLNATPDDGGVGEDDNVKAVENVTGGSGNDTLAGSSGPNVLIGGDGQDTIRDFAGADTVQGGDGDDKFLQSATADAGDSFNGGTGSDLLSYAGRSTTVNVTLATGVGNEGAVGEGDEVVSVENASGGGGDDDLVGSGAANTLRGGGGADTVNGQGGADLLFGEGANDHLNSQDGVDGNDTVNGGSGTDTAATDPGDIRIAIP